MFEDNRLSEHPVKLDGMGYDIKYSVIVISCHIFKNCRLTWLTHYCKSVT